jgi:hypothetical protein
MPLPVIPGVVRAAVTGNLPSGTQWANVVHFRYAGGASSPGPAEITALHAKLTRLWSGAAYGAGTAWLTHSQTSVTTTNVVYYVLNGTAVAEERAFVAAGSLSTGLEPPEVAHVLTLRTATRGRSYRGRVYLPPVCVVRLDTNGNLGSTALNGIQTQWSGLQADLNTIQWSMGVASYLRSVFTDAISATMDVRPDVQRRRKR